MLGSVADVRDFHQVKAAVDAGVEHFGRLDIVLANAGIAPVGFRELSIEEELAQWRAVVGVNLDGAYHAAQAAIPHLLAGNRGGVDHLHQFHGGAERFRRRCRAAGLGYSASKHGIVGLMRTLANALGASQHSGQHRAPNRGQHHDGREPCDDGVPGELSRFGGPHLQNPLPVEMLEPADISAAIAYLVSDEGQVRHRCDLPGRRRLLQQAMSAQIDGAARPSGRVAGKRVLVTGAARGMGRSHAVRLAAGGRRPCPGRHLRIAG